MKRMITKIIFSSIVFILFSGGQQNLRDTGTKMPSEAAGKAVSVLASEKAPDKEEIFSVSYQISGRNVLVECFVPGISFRTDDQRMKLGKIAVWMDGKKIEEVRSAAFVVKNLPVGDHRIKLELLKLTNERYGSDREIFVSIPY